MATDGWIDKEPIYTLLPDGGFVIEEYPFSKPFSSFFPGVAGLYGIPLWCFYVNRGQAIASFGTRDKDGAILEFFPANKSYQTVSRLGFRTFIKFRRESDFIFYEPFQNGYLSRTQALQQKMIIYPHELQIEEVNRTLGLKIRVTYYTLPGEALPGLVRLVSIRNLSASKVVDLEVVDGLPVILPYGMNQFIVKNMSRTAEAWMQARHIDDFVGFYKVRVELDDRPEVVKVVRGNFGFTVRYNKKGPQPAPIISDPEVLFGNVLDFDYPEQFLEDRNYIYPEDQFLQNKTPCCFSFHRVKIPPSGEFEFVSVYGQARNDREVARFSARFLRDVELPIRKREENRRIIAEIMEDVFTVSSFVEFDRYTAQSYLDNLLRGGYPVRIPTLDGYQICYVYGRKHGDLERDYNNFRLEPTFFSQGNGNYRDMNQNRRLDAILHPETGDSNLKLFMNLIQLDGYNPLQINGVRFSLRQSEAELSEWLGEFVGERGLPALKEFLLKREFTLGELFSFLRDSAIRLKGGPERFLRTLLSHCDRIEDAVHIEGFWTDHWSYNLDLIESYLSMFPEREFTALFQDRSYTFFDNDHFVVGREDKFVLTPAGVRQYKAVRFSEEKAELISSREKDKNKVRTLYGKGSVYYTTLIGKLFTLLATKVMNLDPYGCGIEMEADKPNWYDSLNGLPGLIGSSSAETIEVLRLIRFLKETLRKYKDNVSSLAFPEEVADLFVRQGKDLFPLEDTFAYWEKEEEIRQDYRKKTFWGISGKEREVSTEELLAYLEEAEKVFSRAVERAKDPKTGLIRTYFYYSAEEYEVLDGKFHISGMPSVKVKRFSQHVLPLFLEGQVHYLRIADSKDEVSRVYEAVKKSPLYDGELGMYKVCASLKNETLEIGRSAVFTPGWLENESIWLHMEYKYLLELLRRGLGKRFYSELLKTAICFQKPSVYGRSILENSSFIVSSAFPDSSQWGRGFVARLTGSTVEWLHIWLVMCVGTSLFTLGEDGELLFTFDPRLPEWLFTSETKHLPGRGTLPSNSFAFNLFSGTLVVYHNPNRYDTFEDRVGVVEMKLVNKNGERFSVKGKTLKGRFAELLRAGGIKEVWARIDKTL